MPSEDSAPWDGQKPDNDAPAWGAWDTAQGTAAAAPAADAAAQPVSAPAPAAAGLKTSIIPEGTQKTWASMLRQSTVPKPAAKPKDPHPADALDPLPPAVELAHPEPEPPIEESAESVKEAASPGASAMVIPEIALPPSKDQLTETNVEQIAGSSDTGPPLSETIRSEAADSWDPRASTVGAIATPLSASQLQHQGSKAPQSGFAATAIKATERIATRTPGYARRILDQEEAVRMPGNRDVDRATVQFGALNFNGVDDDIDGDREEPETRAQPPGDSPVAHPRTSLPPIPQPAPVPESYAAQKPPAALHSTAAGPAGTAIPANILWGGGVPTTDVRPAVVPSPTVPQPPVAPAQGRHFLCPLSVPGQRGSAKLMTRQVTQPSAQTASFGRFGAGHPDQAFGQKPFDSFVQQGQPAVSAAAVASPYESLHAQQHAAQQHASQQPQVLPQQQQPQQPQPGGGFSSAPSEISSYYTADHARNPYHYYNQSYGQQQQQQHHQPQHQQHQQQQQQSAQVGQEGTAHAQRSFIGAGGGSYNTPQTENLSQYPQSGASRYGAAAVSADVQNSGNSTPNPPAQQNAQAAQAQSHGQGPPHSGQQYPVYAGHPYFSSPYYANYVGHGYQQAFGQGAFSGPYAKGAYGQHPYPPYDHGASSQASGFSAQSSGHRADSGLASGLGEFGRAASGQSANQPGLGAGSGFGSVHDGFGRGSSAYQLQSGQSFGAQSGQQGVAVPSGADDLKPYGDAKGAVGPSPSLAGARPGSAANTNPSQSGLPPPQSAQQGGAAGAAGYGSYPGHLQQGHGLHGNQSAAAGYGMGGAAAQSHGNTPYGGGNYGGGGQGFGASYYGNQQRGWGNNYH